MPVFGSGSRSALRLMKCHQIWRRLWAPRIMSHDLRVKLVQRRKIIDRDISKVFFLYKKSILHDCSCAGTDDALYNPPP